jgi:uroporphyrinogen-III synthase
MGGDGVSERVLRVAVTREEAADGPLGEALRRRGMLPVGCSVVAEAPPPDPAPLRGAASDLERYDWLVVASVRAVTALMGARDLRPLPAGLRTAAVGPRTAAELVACGASAPVTARTAGAGPLMLALSHADSWPGRRVLLPRAAEGRRDLGDSLRRYGAQVDEVTAYRTVARPPDEIAAAWRRAAPEAVVVASPSAARALVAAIGAEPLRRLEPVVAIGSTTAMALVALGVRAIVPERAEFEAVAELLARTRRWRGTEAAP